MGCVIFNLQQSKCNERACGREKRHVSNEPRSIQFQLTHDQHDRQQDEDYDVENCKDVYRYLTDSLASSSIVWEPLPEKTP